MWRFLCAVCVFFFALMSCSDAFCAEYYVATSGDDMGTGVFSSPFRSISKGFSVLRAGDVLHVLSGVYSIDKVVTLRFSGEEGKPITIRGEKGAVLVGTFNKSSNTKEHGPDSYSGVKLFGKWGVIENLEFANMGGSCVGGEVQNFVFDNLILHDYSNYGMILAKSKNVRVVNCNIYNSAYEHGVYLTGENSDISFEKCTIYNTAVNGVHINGKAAGVVISRSLFVNNSAGWGSCVTAIRGASDIVVKNCVFYNNLGHIFTVGDGVVTLCHNTVFNNGSRKGQVLIPVAMLSGLTMRNNIFVTNAYAFENKDQQLYANVKGIDNNIYSPEACQKSFFSKVGIERHGVCSSNVAFVNTSSPLDGAEGMNLRSQSDGTTGAPYIPAVADDYQGNKRFNCDSFGAFARPSSAR